jgi:hypothetical protein
MTGRCSRGTDGWSHLSAINLSAIRHVPGDRVPVTISGKLTVAPEGEILTPPCFHSSSSSCIAAETVQSASDGFPRTDLQAQNH